MACASGDRGNVWYYPPPTEPGPLVEITENLSYYPPPGGSTATGWHWPGAPPQMPTWKCLSTGTNHLRENALDISSGRLIERQGKLTHTYQI